MIGGSGCEGTSLTIDMSCRMAAAGADAVMVLTPCYFKNKMDVPALVGHYNKVADSSPVPVFLYNIPMATGYVLFNFMAKQCNITPQQKTHFYLFALINRLDLPAEVAIECATHPNIVGMKESGGDVTKIGMIMSGTNNNPKNFCVLAGATTFLCPPPNLGRMEQCVGLET